MSSAGELRVTGRGYYYWGDDLYESLEVSNEEYIDCER